MPLYSIDPNIKQPAYLQLYLQIRQDITSGLCPYESKSTGTVIMVQYPEGTKIPKGSTVHVEFSGGTPSE